MSSTSDEVGHTATPWNAREYVAPVGNWYVKGFGGETVISGLGLKRGDALIIERAVNSHVSLVKALENAESALRYCEQNSLSPNDILRPKVEVTIKSITAALSQAKGGK